jgi:AcrR family transcriptional regulator
MTPIRGRMCWIEKSCSSADRLDVTSSAMTISKPCSRASRDGLLVPGDGYRDRLWQHEASLANQFMRKSSQMSSPKEKNTARAPQRERGKQRVAALLKAAVTLFAEKGYDAVTMTEVAARAGAPIGSLYQFFPSKEALADAFLDGYGKRLDDALNGIEERATTLTIPELVDALLDYKAGFQEERAAATALIESRQEASTRATELRLSLRRHVARILRARIPELSPERAESMALVVVQLMKAIAAQSAEKDLTIRDSLLKELRHVLCIYLKENMAYRVDDDSVIR